MFVVCVCVVLVFLVYVCAISLLSLSCCTSICGLLWALPTPNTSFHMQFAHVYAWGVSCPASYSCVPSVQNIFYWCSRAKDNSQVWKSEVVKPKVLDTLVVFICIIINTRIEPEFYVSNLISTVSKVTQFSEEEEYFELTHTMRKQWRKSHQHMRLFLIPKWQS